MLTAALRCFQATFTRRDGTPVGTGPWMTEERANAGCGFGRQDVFELAGLLGDFPLVVHVKRLSEKTLRQAMAADDVFGALAPLLCEDDHALAVSGKIRGRTESHVAPVEHLLVHVRLSCMDGKIH